MMLARARATVGVRSANTGVRRPASASLRPACRARVQQVPLTPRRLTCTAAAEDAAAAATAEADAEQQPESTQSNGSIEEQEQVMSPLDRARQALQADSIDKTLMEELLAELEGEVYDLRDQLGAAAGAATRAEVLEGTVATTKDQLLRLTADFDNFRKRTATEKDELSSRAKGDVVASLLPLVDNFELARTQVLPETEGEEKINNSYQGLYKQMVDILKALGVEPVDTVGAAFDPELHEAIMREPNDDVPDGTVLLEFRKGFRMGERLLRPAMVKVSFTDSPSAADTTGAVTDSEPNSIDEAQ